MHTVKCFLSRFTMYVGKKTSLKNFSEGGRTLAWLIHCEMRGSDGILERPDLNTLLKAVSERHKDTEFQATSTASDLTCCKKIEDRSCRWMLKSCAFTFPTKTAPPQAKS